MSYTVIMIVGIDEVGRGCWAGPLVAGAVALPDAIDGLNDSKLLSKTRRTLLNQQIFSSAHCGLGWVESWEVDNLGLTKAVALAMQRAYDELAIAAEEVIIDGNINYLPSVVGTRALIKADQTVPEVSAASIIAKVARDEFMLKQHDQYPEYGFDKHVGYGTAAHIRALQQHGPCKIHRMSYKPIKALLD